MVSYRAPNVNSERRKTWGLSSVQPLDFIPAPAACTPERMNPYSYLTVKGEARILHVSPCVFLGVFIVL